MRHLRVTLRSSFAARIDSLRTWSRKRRQRNSQRHSRRSRSACPLYSFPQSIVVWHISNRRRPSNWRIQRQAPRRQHSEPQITL